jgi:hypothetical protein
MRIDGCREQFGGDTEAETIRNIAQQFKASRIYKYANGKGHPHSDYKICYGPDDEPGFLKSVRKGVIFEPLLVYDRGKILLPDAPKNESANKAEVVRWKCAACGETLKAKASSAGKRAKCIHCSAGQTIPVLDGKRGPSKPIPEATAHGFIVDCPTCDAANQAERADIGKQFQCAHCESSFKLGRYRQTEKTFLGFLVRFIPGFKVSRKPPPGFTKVIDTRCADEQNEDRWSRSPLDGDLEDIANRLCRVETEEEIRRIGTQLDRRGGHALMRLVYYRTRHLGRDVLRRWDGIGEWRYCP